MNADNAWKVLTDSLDQEVALDNAKVKLVELEAAAKLAFGSGAQADIDAYEQQAAEFVGMLAAISGGIDTVSSKDILLRFKTQGPAAALALATFLANGSMDGDVYDSFRLEGITARANGGPVNFGNSYLVGEQGPELFTPTSSGNITPNHALGGGGTINITVTSADPNEVVRALQTYVRQSGPVPVNTRTM
jgi:phage-related minor tail protein